MRKVKVLFTFEDNDLGTYERLAVAKALLELARMFEVETEYEPPLSDWNVREMRKEIIKEWKDERSCCEKLNFHSLEEAVELAVKLVKGRPPCCGI